MFARESNKLEAAREEFQAALAIFREVHEPSHINTRTCYRQLGMLEKDAQNWKEGTAPTAHGRGALSPRRSLTHPPGRAPPRPRPRPTAQRCSTLSRCSSARRRRSA